ncbi:hypothetical protein BCR39DRAFT_169196 [Naematelia encephala]|uniref:Uncharacterized protein n=1 Tax=Naematelia encephala TaxID=71784 RepID=A0A1Y2B5X8_9TREE|nr:hypothetical protein BCR39DRAFT_169196 [Naematelia encephala]
MVVSMTTSSTTPPKAMPTCYIDEIPETPGPIRARVNNLQKQIDELVRKEHALNRKHKSEMSAVESTISLQRTELGQTHLALKASQSEAARYKVELERCQAEGEAMRQELNVHSVVQQHKALLVLAQEQMQIIELEQRLVQAEAARIMRDHKLALFQAKEDDLGAELAEKDAVLAQVEAKLDKANTSLAHERAANSKTSKLSNSAGNQQELSEARAEVTRMEGKVERLEGKVRALKEGEKEAREELEQWARDERGKHGSVSLISLEARIITEYCVLGK